MKVAECEEVKVTSENFTSGDSFTATVPIHGVVLLKTVGQFRFR
jgi:hypothetical protein